MAAKMTEGQKNVLVVFMLRNRALRRGHVSRLRRRQLWSELKRKLNEYPGGVKMSSAQWQRAWIETKNSIHQKVNKLINQDRDVDYLTRAEAKLATLFTNQPIVLVQGVQAIYNNKIAKILNYLTAKNYGFVERLTGEKLFVEVEGINETYNISDMSTTTSDNADLEQESRSKEHSENSLKHLEKSEKKTLSKQILEKCNNEELSKKLLENSIKDLKEALLFLGKLRINLQTIQSEQKAMMNFYEQMFPY